MGADPENSLTSLTCIFSSRVLSVPIMDLTSSLEGLTEPSSSPSGLFCAGAEWLWLPPSSM